MLGIRRYLNGQFNVRYCFNTASLGVWSSKTTVLIPDTDGYHYGNALTRKVAECSSRGERLVTKRPRLR